MLFDPLCISTMILSSASSAIWCIPEDHPAMVLIYLLNIKPLGFEIKLHFEVHDTWSAWHFSHFITHFECSITYFLAHNHFVLWFHVNTTIFKHKNLIKKRLTFICYQVQLRQYWNAVDLIHRISDRATPIFGQSLCQGEILEGWSGRRSDC